MNVQKAEQFILKTARPIELAEFRCLFQNGPKEAVLEALRPFQNPDGGFGHALEPDNWNPNSTPITTNTALGILFRTGALELAPDMAQGMVRYIRSAQDPATGRWPFAIGSNKDHPHAIWWEENSDSLSGWNPGVSLAAFLVCQGQDAYRETLQRAFADWEQAQNGDAAKCYILACQMLEKYGIGDVVDLDKAWLSIRQCVEKAVCKDTEKYGVEYVTTPSWFPKDCLPESLLPQIQAELESLPKMQKEDGGFDISWQWYTPYEKEFAQARDWWRPRVTMEKLEFYQDWA